MRCLQLMHLWGAGHCCRPRLTGGAHCRFDTGSAQQLKDLLSAVAVYAAGGRRALEDFGRRRGGTVPLLTRQLQKG